MPRLQIGVVKGRIASLLAIAMLASGSMLWAAEESAPDKPKTEASKKSDASKKTETRRRLPPHYADVVTEEQREAIYKLQDEHAPEIEEHEAKLIAVRKKLDDAVRGVLKPEQLKKVDEAAAAAAKKRASRRSSASSGDTSTAPATTPARTRRRAR
jgi:hypothetical protein